MAARSKKKNLQPQFVMLLKFLSFLTTLYQILFYKLTKHPPLKLEINQKGYLDSRRIIKYP